MGWAPASPHRCGPVWRGRPPLHHRWWSPGSRTLPPNHPPPRRVSRKGASGPWRGSHPATPSTTREEGVGRWRWWGEPDREPPRTEERVSWISASVGTRAGRSARCWCLETPSTRCRRITWWSVYRGPPLPPPPLPLGGVETGAAALRAVPAAEGRPCRSDTGTVLPGEHPPRRPLPRPSPPAADVLPGSPRTATESAVSPPGPVPWHGWCPSSQQRAPGAGWVPTTTDRMR